MAVSVEKGVTTITPTAWKWLLGAAVLFFIPPIGTIVAIAFALTATGKLQNVVLNQDGFQTRTWWNVKKYSWEDVGDFRTYKLKSGFITAASMVSFTPAKSEGKVWAKAAKFLSGGTHSIPAVGMPAKKLVVLMHAYKQGLMRSDELINSVIGGKVGANRPQTGASAGPKPVAPAGKPETFTPPLAANARPANTQDTKPSFGSAAPMAPPKAAFGKANTGGSPLVQDSPSRKRMTNGW